MRQVRIAVALTALAIPAVASAASPIAGRWVNPSHSVIINVAPCGDAQCGTVVWASAKAKADALAGTPNLVGTQLLTDLRRNGGQWEGELFVPDHNLRVDARIEPIGGNGLKVSGCALGGLLCDSQTWTRSKGKLPPR